MVEPDGTVTAVDAELDAAWGVSRISSGIVHAGGNTGAGVYVAIIDTGIDCTHPDLDGNCVGGFDFVNNDNDPSDDHGHGTHVAGTVAAEDNGAGVVGVAPNVSLYGLKVLNANGGGYWSDIVAAMEWAADNGIQVTNNSYGSGGHPGSIVEAAFGNAAAQGVLHIAAAGNSGSCAGTENTVGYPARFASVVAVAATNALDERTCFSSTGPEVEIAAPGMSINSTRVGGGDVHAGVMEPAGEEFALDEKFNFEARQQDLVEHPGDQLVLADGQAPHGITAVALERACAWTRIINYTLLSPPKFRPLAGWRLRGR